MFTNFQKFVVSKIIIIFLKKLALQWPKLTVKTFIMLQKIYM